MTIPFTEHPCLPPVTDEWVRAIVQKHGSNALQKFKEYERQRQQAIVNAKENPLEHGWELECWREADAVLADPETILLANLGGNGSSKTTWAVHRAMRIMCEEPGAPVLFLHESQISSIKVHQRMVFDLLPASVKPSDHWKPRKTTTTRIAYNLDTGFIGQGFALPNKSTATFGFYTQDVGIYEGTGWRFIVFDEDAPLGWIETLLYRLGRCGGKAVWCFTAIDGITPAVKAVTAGAITLKSRPVDPELLPPTHRVLDDQDWPVGEMPYLQKSPREGVKIIYFHSDMNPLAGYDPEKGRPAFHAYREIIRLSKDKPFDYRERRAYGFARNTMRQALNFTAAHILSAEKMAERLKRPHTNYMVLDPAGARNFCLLLFAVDADGFHYFTDEWPDVEGVGEWAVPSDDPARWDGKPGPGQLSLRYGIVDYKQLILRMERGRDIFQRFIDPRSGVVQSAADDSGESSLISRFMEEQTGDRGEVIGPSMLFEPAYSGKVEDDGLTQINDLLRYERTQPITALLNEPKLYVAEGCQNLIWAMQNYTAHDGQKAACKDFIDCLRYAVLKRCLHIEPGMLAGVAGGGW